MIINENKNGAKTAIIFGLILFVFSIVGYFYGLGNSAFFALGISLICIVVCIKKLRQISYVKIEDDGFFIKKGEKELKVYYKDIKKIDTKTIEYKQNFQILSIEFKKAGFDDTTKLLRLYSDKEAVFPDFYEKSIHTIGKILKEKLENFNSK